MDSKNAVDLLNVDYDDVLHLYRGWRRSEGLLQDKNKELAALKGRIKQLQDSHVKFRSQIQALESVKELTVTLQTQLSVFQQENIQLISENKELLELNAHCEQKLHKVTQELSGTKDHLHDVEIRGENMKGRYEEATSSNLQMEKLATEEQAKRQAAEARLRQAEEYIEQLESEKKELQNRVHISQARVEDTNRELGEVAKQLTVYSNEVTELGVAKEQLATAEAERDIVKGDIARLLRLLEHYPAAKGFVKRWQDNQGLSFIGSEHSQTNKSSSRIYHTSHDASGDNDSMTPEELAHLKRLHGNNDPYPMSSSMEEEISNWVPEEAARLSASLLDSRLTAESPGGRRQVIQEFLRQANKIWMKREARKMRRIQDKYAEYIADLKRQLANLRPYHGVMAERQIRRLATQVKEERSKRLKGRPKKWSPDDDVMSDEEGVLNTTSTSRSISAPRSRSSAHNDASFRSSYAVATNLHSSRTPENSNQNVGDLLESSLLSINNTVHHHSSGSKIVPSLEYLKGAMWLGRNLVMKIEALVDKIENFRTTYLREVTLTANDGDSQRACQRLTLLAASRVGEIVAAADEEKLNIRRLVHVCVVFNDCSN